MRARLLIAVVVTLLCAGATAVALASTEDGREGKRSSYEVWTIDQSNTRPDGGGNLYVYNGEQLAEHPAGAQPQKVDLGAGAREMLSLIHI